MRQGRIRDFFRRGRTRLLLYFNTNKSLIIIIFFFGRIPVVLENRRSSQGGGSHPLHPPPRSAPVCHLKTSMVALWTTKKKLHHNHTLLSHFIIFKFVVWPPNNVSIEMFAHNRAVLDAPSTLSPHSLTFETDWQRSLLDVGEQM